MQTLRTLCRHAMWALLAGLLVACGSGGGEPPGGNGGGSGGPTTLFQEPFVGPFPGTLWTQSIAGTLTLDGAVGNPAPPCLMIDGTGSTQANATMNPTFDSSSGLSVYLFIAVDTATLTQIVSASSIEIVNSGVTMASLQISAGEAIRYRIKPSGGSLTGTTETLSLGDGFHDYWFVISPDGIGSWYRDGFLKYTNPFPMDHGSYTVRLHSSASVGRFDQVEVTRP